LVKKKKTTERRTHRPPTGDGDKLYAAAFARTQKKKTGLDITEQLTTGNKRKGGQNVKQKQSSGAAPKILGSKKVRFEVYWETTQLLEPGETMLFES